MKVIRFLIDWPILSAVSLFILVDDVDQVCVNFSLIPNGWRSKPIAITSQKIDIYKQKRNIYLWFPSYFVAFMQSVFFKSRNYKWKQVLSSAKNFNNSPIIFQDYSCRYVTFGTRRWWNVRLSTACSLMDRFFHFIKYVEKKPFNRDRDLDAREIEHERSVNSST